jgi:hypothetical protein
MNPLYIITKPTILNLRKGVEFHSVRHDNAGVLQDLHAPTRHRRVLFLSPGLRCPGSEAEEERTGHSKAVGAWRGRLVLAVGEQRVEAGL